MSNFSVNFVPADNLTLLGARIFADARLTKFGIHIYS